MTADWWTLSWSKTVTPSPRWIASGIIKIIIVINFDQHWSFSIKIVILSKNFVFSRTQPNFGSEFYLDEFLKIQDFKNLKNFDGFLCRGACSTCLLLIFSGSVSSKTPLPCYEKNTVFSSPKNFGRIFRTFLIAGRFRKKIFSIFSDKKSFSRKLGLFSGWIILDYLLW